MFFLIFLSSAKHGGRHFYSACSTPSPPPSPTIEKLPTVQPKMVLDFLRFMFLLCFRLFNKISLTFEQINEQFYSWQTLHRNSNSPANWKQEYWRACWKWKKRLHRGQSLVCVGYDLNYRCQINSELLIKLLKPTNFS